MANEHEIRFAKERQILQLRFREIIDVTQIALGLDNMVALESRLVPHDGVFREDTIAGQQIIQSWTFASPTGARNKIEIAVGPTGQEWNPVITFNDDFGTSEVIVCGDRDWPDLSTIRQMLVESIRKTK